MNLKALATITGILFVISLGVFYLENQRGTDLVEGSDYIQGLDIGKIHKISLSFSKDKDENIIFNRDGSRFVIENHKSYPASTEKINDLIYQIASLQIKEKVTSSPSESDLKEYELDADSRQYLVEIYDNDNKKTVSFSVGKSHKGRGNYLYKEGGDSVYLSKESIWINSSYRNFVDTSLLDVKKDDIETVQLETDTLIELAKKDKEFTLVKPEQKDFKKEKVEEYFNSFSGIQFSEFYKHNDEEIQKLSFDKGIKVHLKNKLTYKLSLSEKENEHFIKVNALTHNIPQQMTLNAADKEQVKQVEDMAKARTVAERFNLEKGAWIYKVSPSTFEKLVKKTKDFL